MMPPIDDDLVNGFSLEVSLELLLLLPPTVSLRFRSGSCKGFDDDDDEEKVECWVWFSGENLSKKFVA